MSDLENILDRFNRKERHWLIRSALGDGAIRLGSKFSDHLEAAVRRKDPTVVIPPKVWWATDYHIDWLVAALRLYPYNGELMNGQPQDNTAKEVVGHQQDVDLLIAFGSTVVLIEAKGVGSWSGQGLTNRIRRLARLGPPNGDLINSRGMSATGVQLFFVLCSPEEPNLDVQGWPNWTLDGEGSPLWMKLDTPGGREKFLKVTRCDDQGRSSASGTHWRLVREENLFNSSD
jgi:hypothetical protein